MNVSTRKDGDVTIIDVDGKLLIENSHMLRGTVRDALEAGSKKIIVNLANVAHVDSSGLGELISSFTTSQQRGAKLKLERPTVKLHDLLVITKLITVFEVFDDEKEAVASFK